MASSSPRHDPPVSIPPALNVAEVFLEVEELWLDAYIEACRRACRARPPVSEERILAARARVGCPRRPGKGFYGGW